jgi:hypothetical protein
VIGLAEGLRLTLEQRHRDSLNDEYCLKIIPGPAILISKRSLTPLTSQTSLKILVFLTSRINVNSSTTFVMR